MNWQAFRVLSLVVVVALQVAGGQSVAHEGSTVGQPSELSAPVDHPLVPLATVSTKIFTGEEVDKATLQRIATRVEETVRPHVERVAGIDVTVVDVDDYHNGALHDVTEEYFAQGADGTVYYVGERVDEYAHGRIVNHDGTWLSGEQGIQPGVFMPAEPAVGGTFSPEHAPDVAMEQVTVIAVEQPITTAAGSFEGCLVTKEIGFPEGVIEEKTYCPDVGLVRESFPGGQLELVTFKTALETTS
jgi:hypothetical protein